MFAIDDLRRQRSRVPPLLRLGFRPFFLFGSLYAALAVLVWALVYGGWWPAPSPAMPVASWHGHEMIFGYGMAVVAGFLLTAVKNWTGAQTAFGWRLALLVALWGLARFGALTDTPWSLALMMVGDLAFGVLVVVEAGRPLLLARQWKQLGILAKLAGLGLANALFYAGVLGWHDQALHWGLWSGFYLLVGLVIVMGRRVIPFFIERGTGGRLRGGSGGGPGEALVIGAWLGFFVLEVFTSHHLPASVIALGLAAIYLFRLWQWHHPGLWRQPLLWSLYLSQAFIALGFLMLGLRPLVTLPGLVAMHALACGGIGLVSLGMMARVAWGHSGREVLAAPAGLGPIFGLLLIGAVVRVLMPLAPGLDYATLVLASQILWIIAFAGFALLYAPVLLRPRVDGGFG